MRQALVAAGGCAVAFAVLTGCSSQESKPETGTGTPGQSAPAQASAAPAPPTPVGPDAGHVTLGGEDVGPVTAVGCDTQQGLTTITVAAGKPATVVVTDEAAPTVKSVSIGEVGPNGPTLAYLEGVAASPAQANRDGGKYTVSGTGLGTDPADPSRPTQIPFEIAVTCP
jgi:lipoprotein LpqH